MTSDSINVASENVTSATLLMRLRDPGDDQAWESFYQRYAPLIVRFCLDSGCSEDQSLEVVQETLVYLMRRLVTFSYDRGRGKFRSYLLSVVQGRITDSFRRTRRASQLFADSVSQCEVDQVLDSGGEAPGGAWDRHWEEMLLGLALERVRLRVHPRTWRSFDLYVLAGVDVDEVARKLGVKRNAVYQHRNRLIELLKQETAFLEKELEDIPW